MQAGDVCRNDFYRMGHKKSEEHIQPVTMMRHSQYMVTLFGELSPELMAMEEKTKEEIGLSRLSQLPPWTSFNTCVMWYL